MKSTFRILLLTFVFSTLFTQCEKEEPEPKGDIKDVNFLLALHMLGVDYNGDGNISPAEASNVTYLDVSKRNIANTA